MEEEWNKRPFKPNWVSPPGATIQDALQERGWTPHYLAKQLGITDQELEELFEGKLAISPKLAAALAITFGNSPSFWLNRERQYSEDLLELNKKKKKEKK